MNVGTGMFKLLQKHVHGIDVQRRPLIFDTPEFHLSEMTS